MQENINRVVFALLLAGFLPWATLQDIQPDEVIASSYVTTCEGAPTVSLALRHASGEYWMLWFNDAGWIAAPFGRERPAEGTLPVTLYFGRWQKDAENTRFRLSHTAPVPAEPAERVRTYCGWLAVLKDA